MGNKGGRIHDPKTQTLLKRKWASKRWIICVTQFKQRQRKVMGDGYTELFFLDEVSALASGHRPCFECRRRDASNFAHHWQAAFGKISGSIADNIDIVLHAERTSKKPELSGAAIVNLPNGAMIKSGDQCFAKHDGHFFTWTGLGYEPVRSAPKRSVLLTPPSILPVLSSGYTPIWHPSVK